VWIHYVNSVDSIIRIIWKVKKDCENICHLKKERHAGRSFPLKRGQVLFDRTRLGFGFGFGLGAQTYLRLHSNHHDLLFGGRVPSLETGIISRRNFFNISGQLSLLFCFGFLLVFVLILIFSYKVQDL